MMRSPVLDALRQHIRLELNTEVAIRLLQNNVPIQVVAESLELPLELVRRLSTSENTECQSE